MIIRASCTFELRNGKRIFLSANGETKDAPEWVKEHPYFEALLKDGRVSVFEDAPSAKKEKGKK